MRLDRLGETALHRLLAPIGYPKGVPLPPGDDAGAVWLGARALLLKTDGFRARDVRLAGMPEEAVGWRAVTAVASDLLAKLAQPLGFVLSIFLPPSAEVKRARSWVVGAARAAGAYGAGLLGGDTNRGEAALSAAGVGISDDPLPRGGVAGDWVLLVGDRWGRSGAAIDAHYRGVDLAPFPRVRAAGHWPRARLALLGLSPFRRWLSGSADSSDGLAETLWQLAEAAGLGIQVDRIPLFPDVLDYARVAGVEPEELVLFGGEEYEAVVLVRPEGRALVGAWLRSVGLPHTWAGRVGGEGVRFQGVRLPRRGYRQF